MPPTIYDYIMELSYCAKSEQNRLTNFCGEIGRFEFFLLAHTQSVKNKFLHLVYRSQICKETFMSQNARAF